MAGEPVLFDDVTRSSMSDQPVPAGGVPRALRIIAEGAGLDVTAELYNESLRFATEGHLKLARERLGMLLAMTPEDGESRLLLAKILVAGQRWKDSLSALDEAQACGQEVPRELRRAVEDHLRAEVAAEEEQRTALRAREQGEIKALRQEARRLRSENAQYVGHCHELEQEARKWAWTTAGVSSLAILFIAANLIFGGRSEPAAETEILAGEPMEIVADAPMEVAALEPIVEGAVEDELLVPAPPVRTVAERAAEALQVAPGLDGAALEVTVSSGSAVVTGEVDTHLQRKTAEKVLIDLDGIDEVDTSTVAVAARTLGTTHTVAKNDTLSGLAYRYYGDSSLHKKILSANHTQLRGRANLSLGQVLVIPPIE